MTPGARALASDALRWLVVSIVLALVLFIPVMTLTYTFFKTHREPGWGRKAELFPILVLTPRGDGKQRANIVYREELTRFLTTAGNYTFVVPNRERESVQDQIRALQSEQGGNGKYEVIALHLADRGDGSQRIHLIATEYEDTDNESWYIARPKAIEPQYHRYAVGIGVGMAAAFATPIVLAIAAPLLALAIVARRRFRGHGTPRRTAIRRSVIAVAIYCAGIIVMYADSDQTLWQDIAEIGGSAIVLVGIMTAFWWPDLHRWHRVATVVTVVVVAAAIFAVGAAGNAVATMAALLATVTLLLLIVAVSFVGNVLYEWLSAV